MKEEVKFCLYCYLFKIEINSQGGSNSFASDGFKGWNKISRLDVLDVASAHNMAVQKCQDLIKLSQFI